MIIVGGRLSEFVSRETGRQQNRSSTRTICDQIGDAGSQRGPAWTRIANDDGQHASKRFIGVWCNGKAHRHETRE